MTDAIAWLRHYLALEREAHTLRVQTGEVEPYGSVRARLLPFLGPDIVGPPELYDRKSADLLANPSHDASLAPRKLFQVKRRHYRAPGFAPAPVGEFFQAYVGPIEGQSFYLMSWFLWPGEDGQLRLQTALFVCSCSGKAGSACTECAGVEWLPAPSVGPDWTRLLGGPVLEVEKLLRPTRARNVVEYDRPD